MFDALYYPVTGRLVPVPAVVWRPLVHFFGRDAARMFKALTPLQRKLRHVIVRDMPGANGPMNPQDLAESVGASIEQVVGALEVLERLKGFLYRNDTGAVAWAYPFTTDDTPHHLTFSTGERRDAA